VKLASFGPFVVPAGIVAYPVTFLLSDVVCEVYGKKTATSLVWLGLAANGALVAFIVLGRILPASPFWQQQASYNSILGMIPRIVAASLLAYVVSQHHDVWAFDFWKRRTSGRHLWLRNNASTAVSQALDSALFALVAFGGTVPTAVLLNLIGSQYLLKLLFALGDTPLCYVLVAMVRRRTGPATLRSQAT
jgi:uncharacterized integral membrane protein (TIGR00697 family)